MRIGYFLMEAQKQTKTQDQNKGKLKGNRKQTESKQKANSKQTGSKHTQQRNTHKTINMKAKSKLVIQMH